MDALFGFFDPAKQAAPAVLDNIAILFEDLIGNSRRRLMEFPEDSTYLLSQLEG
jgi:hypothetical protein